MKKVKLRINHVGDGCIGHMTFPDGAVYKLPCCRDDDGVIKAALDIVEFYANNLGENFQLVKEI